jgi:hypothetical protein
LFWRIKNPPPGRGADGEHDHSGNRKPHPAHQRDKINADGSTSTIE